MKKLNKNRIFYVVMGVLILGVLIVTGIKVYKDFFAGSDKEGIKPKELENLDKYGYTLNDLDTKLYKDYFNHIKEELNKEEIDNKAYATLLVQLFVTDFYTLSNKITSGDIGGVEFVHPSILSNFKLNAGDTMYNHVKNNVYGDRKQDLPTVKEVVIDEVTEETYVYNGTTYEAFKITATWEYETDLGYDKSGTFYLIKDNDKLNIVEKQ